MHKSLSLCFYYHGNGNVLYRSSLELQFLIPRDGSNTIYLLTYCLRKQQWNKQMLNLEQVLIPTFYHYYQQWFYYTLKSSFIHFCFINKSNYHRISSKGMTLLWICVKCIITWYIPNSFCCRACQERTSHWTFIGFSETF